MTAPVTVTLEGLPDLLALSAAHPARYPFLLDSAAPGPLGRYSLLLRYSGDADVLPQGATAREAGAFFQRLDAATTRPRETVGLADAGEPSLPFQGGWFLYLGYEMAAGIEPILALPPAQDGLPAAIAARCDGAFIIDHGPEPVAYAFAESAEVLASMRRDLATTGPLEPGAVPPLAELLADPPEAFEGAIDQVHDYLLAGDVFQVNLSRGWHGTFHDETAPEILYRGLREANPAPFAGLMRWGQQTLMSSSPERLVEVRDGLVQTRPIAGTHRRDPDPYTDQALREALLAHPKERAEHIMLIDLERNDLGRVCVTGSVEVDELMVVESYAHVHHIVSNVRGQLRPDRGPVDVIRAVFPGGTITGCPKVRCMQIIAELEGSGRGYYTGAMGYLDHRGHMDLNILIRSLVTDGRHIQFRTGAGIVADSDPAREVAETGHKARGMLTAIGATEEWH